jgi:hypothetical protein
MVYEQEPCTSEMGQDDLTEKQHLVDQFQLTYLKTRKRQHISHSETSQVLHNVINK